MSTDAKTVATPPHTAAAAEPHYLRTLTRRVSTRIGDQFWRLWYPLLTRLSRNQSVLFLNYGYVGDEPGGDPVLREQDEADRACIQLYHRVVAPVDLRGLDVLEVSCGHGGGAAYVARYHKPRMLHATDRNAHAIELCRTRHSAGNLAFSTGDAMALDFVGEAFDAVINVEASHCYPDLPRFFAGVHRVLRRGGHFLYADFYRDARVLASLQNQLERSGLEVVACEDITPQVVRGMQMNQKKYLELIDLLMPWPLKRQAHHFAGVPGSAIYNELVAGATAYLRYHLRKR